MNTWPIEEWIMNNVPGMGAFSRRYRAWRVLRNSALIGVGFLLGRLL